MANRIAVATTYLEDPDTGKWEHITQQTYEFSIDNNVAWLDQLRLDTINAMHPLRRTRIKVYELVSTEIVKPANPQSLVEILGE